MKVELLVGVSNQEKELDGQRLVPFLLIYKLNSTLIKRYQTNQ